MRTFVCGTYVCICNCVCYISVRLSHNIPCVISGVNFVGNSFIEAENSPVNSRDIILKERISSVCFFLNQSTSSVAASSR